MGKGYAEGPAVEEAQANVERQGTTCRAYAQGGLRIDPAQARAALHRLARRGRSGRAVRDGKAWGISVSEIPPTRRSPTARATARASGGCYRRGHDRAPDGSAFAVRRACASRSLRAIGEVIDSGRFILGPRVAEAEHAFAAHVGAAHGIGVANGTDALVIALRALGVEPGDEVICPSFTFYATAEAIAADRRGPGLRRHRGRDATTSIPTAVEAAITPRTRARRAGAPVRPPGGDGAAARRSASSHGLALLEDAAQAYRRVARRRALRRDRRRGDVLVLPHQEPALLRRRRPDHDARAPRSTACAACCASTAPRTRRRSRTSATTRASTSCRPRSCCELLPLVDGWNDGRIAVAARYEELGLGEHVVAAGRRRRRAPHLPPLRRAHARSASASSPASREAGVGERALLRHAAAPAAGLRAPRLPRGLAARDRALRPRVPRAADVPDARRGRRSSEVVHAVTALAPATA